MLIAASDIETTGLEPGDHRIIEVYVGLYDLATRTKVDEYFQRINPQRSIQPAAQAVHKISIEDLKFSPPWDPIAEDFRNFIERGDLVVGHNWDGFDAPFVNYELTRVKLPKLTKPTFDTMLEGRGATPTGLVPNLGALCWAAGIEYDPAKAHAAQYDVDVMMRAFFRFLDCDAFTLPVSTSPVALAA